MTESIWCQWTPPRTPIRRDWLTKTFPRDKKYEPEVERRHGDVASQLHRRHWRLGWRSSRLRGAPGRIAGQHGHGLCLRLPYAAERQQPIGQDPVEAHENARAGGFRGNADPEKPRLRDSS